MSQTTRQQLINFLLDLAKNTQSVSAKLEAARQIAELIGPQTPVVEKNYLRKKAKQANKGALG